MHSMAERRARWGGDAVGEGFIQKRFHPASNQCPIAAHRNATTTNSGRRFDDVTEFSDADLIVAADGANSTIRSRYKEHFQPSLDERPNLLAWYGTTQLFPALSLIFRQNDDVGPGCSRLCDEALSRFEVRALVGPTRHLNARDADPVRHTRRIASPRWSQ